MRNPELQVHTLKCDELVPYAGNAKVHTPEQVEQIAASIREFGNCDPIAVWHDQDGAPVIVEGHGRLMALQKLGIETAPVIYLDHLTDEQRRAYAHVHNQTTLSSGFDLDALAADMADLPAFDWEGFGFDDVPDLGDQPAEVQEVDTPETAPARVERGQVWQLGDHRLMCGDSTDAADVAALMDGHRAELLFTSPPYSDMREYNGDKELDVVHLAKFISVYSSHCSYQAVNLGIKRRNHEIIRYWDEYIDTAESCGLKVMCWNIWDKTFCGSPAQQGAIVPIRHEFIFVFGKEYKGINTTWDKKPESIKANVIGRRRNPDGTMSTYSEGDTSKPRKKMESVLQCPPNVGPSSKLHPATFPVKLPYEYIRAFTDSGDAVIEPFGGSGTTLMAAEQLGRKCYMMELDPHYCDIIIERWEQFTGRKAVLA